MAHRTALTGNDAAAYALKQVNPDVAAVYPITPQTELMHKFASYVADGDVDTELVLVESEHSAMSATLSASLAGARSITATSSCGLALMWELLYVASGARAPIVMPEVNRALSAPINIHCDHSDTMGARDSGWMQIYAENAQESYDNILQAFRIAEHPDVKLPIMPCLDGFILSHTIEALEVLDDEKVKAFVGEYKPENSLLNVDKPVTFGAFALQDTYFEYKRQQVEAMRNAVKVIQDVGKEYGEISGRSYDLFETYMMDDAEVVIVGIGSTMGTVKFVVNQLRKEGIKAGVLKIRVFRPAPWDKVADALSGAKVVGVMDRSLSFGLEGGPLFNELRSFCRGKKFAMCDFIYGLGGRDIGVTHISDIIRGLHKAAKSGTEPEMLTFVNLRE
ncbi:MAG TPA: pyruvate ferredoxin oxidoreductase [Candidatus Brocadiia bacterium]|nr:pyruvate ferredoxin oxidoreductase [Candidatus Brocadiia bacterium]